LIPVSPLLPINPLTGLLGGAASVGVKFAVGAFVAILNSLFSGIEAKFTLDILKWLTSIADQSGGHIATLYGLTSGMALGLLGAVVTASIVRYWLAGLSMSGSGGFEALEGLLRSIGAVEFLVAWPLMFTQLVALANICSATILSSPSLRSEIAHTINAVVFVTFAAGSPVGLFISIVIAVAGALLFLALLFVKVMLGAATTFLYVAMPLAIVVWPVDELSWLARYAMRAFVALLIVPVAWALIFATFAAVTVNALEFQGAHGFINQVTQPLVALAMLWLVLTVPRTLFRMASSGLGLGRHTGGFASRAGSFLVARQANEGLAQAGLLPFGSGGFLARPRPDGRSGGAGGGGSRPRPSGGGGSGTAGAGGRGPRPSPSPSPAPVIGAALGASSAAVRTPQAAPTATDGSASQDGEAGAVESQHVPSNAQATGRVEAPAPGREPAVGLAVGSSRPERDNPNPLGALPPSTAANRGVLEGALGHAQRAPLPSPADAHGALRNLGGDVRQRMVEAHAHGGAPRVQAEMARFSTSDQISNAQAADFMTLAAASSSPALLDGLLGSGASAPRTDQSAASRAPAASPSPPPLGARELPALPPPRPSVSDQPPSDPRSRSPDVRVRDAVWREAGPGINPRQD
jgi:hypothetical protein